MIKIIIIIILKSNPEDDPRFYNQVVDFKLWARNEFSEKASVIQVNSSKVFFFKKKLNLCGFEICFKKINKFWVN
jgi:hypothetical protein